MKRIILISLLGAIFLFCSCKVGVNNPSTEKEQITDIAIYKTVASSHTDYKEYLKSEFNINLTINSIDDIDNWETLNGIIQVNLVKFKLLFRDRYSKLLPLNRILNENKVISELPPNINNSLADSEGNIWGLLYSHRFNTLSRVYNLSIMENLGINLPADTGDLKEALITVKIILDIPAIKANKQDCVSMFYDIFASFGCPIFDNKYTIGWSEDENMYVDFALSNEMYNSLKYIEELNNYGIIDSEPASTKMIKDAYDKNELFTIVQYDREGINDKYVTNSLGNSNVYIEIGAENSPYIFVIAKNQKNPEAILYNFISSFYGKEKINKSGRYGSESNYVYINENFVSETKTNRIIMPMISDYWLTNWYLPLENQSDENKYSNWEANNKSSYVEAYYQDIYRFVPAARSLALERIGAFSLAEATIHNKFSELFYEFLYKKQSVEEFLLIYQKELKKLGIEEYLNELNDTK